MAARRQTAALPAATSSFADSVIQWQKSHGRHTLPWQNTRDPYRVWLSEIMLQQTQVTTVLDYYARFLERFPNVADLAAASEDEVLGLWSGLGYYSRARHLHRCARDVVALHGGQFPGSAAVLQTLPGIGRSTAAAIASFCFGERVAILDGNVKRVLARALAYPGDLAQAAEERKLWDIAGELLPKGNLTENMPRYTQGLMDLGATVCTSRQPQCLICPLQPQCQGFAGGDPQKYPVKSRKLKRSALALSLLWAQRPDGSVWLERRPARGIWGGLYCLPVFADDDALQAAVPARLRTRLQPMPHFLHVLTHKDLHMAPWAMRVGVRQASPLEHPAEGATPSAVGAWFSPTEWPSLGLPAPVRKLLLSNFPGNSG